MKQLKIWNGRPYGVLPSDQWKGSHIYVAAHSVADVLRLCEEVGLRAPSRGEVRDYWSPCWGNAMDGIAVERGVWVTEGYKSKPRRITSNAKVRGDAPPYGAASLSTDGLCPDATTEDKT